MLRLPVTRALLVALIGHISFQLRYIEGSLDDLNEAVRREGK
jgi:hypothetical protein